MMSCVSKELTKISKERVKKQATRKDCTEYNKTVHSLYSIFATKMSEEEKN